MSYKIIPIPGSSTMFDATPEVSIFNPRHDNTSLVIKFSCGHRQIGFPRRLCVLTFETVLEYRWIDDMIEYDAFVEHKEDYEFGLIEIQDSAYIAAILDKGPETTEFGKPLRALLDELDVKHFRLGFDDFGTFDIIALNVSVEEVEV